MAIRSSALNLFFFYHVSTMIPHLPLLLLLLLLLSDSISTHQAQGIANVLSVVPLLALVGNNTTPYITINGISSAMRQWSPFIWCWWGAASFMCGIDLEWFGLVFWLVSFYLENLADTQLASFLVAKKKQQR